MNRSYMNLCLSLIVAAFSLATPFVASAASTFTQVSDGGNAICGVLDDQTAICNSAFNVEARTPSDLPLVEEITASTTAACAVLVGGDLRCWGDQGFGLTNPPTGDGPYKSVSISDSHACAINGNLEIDCWGADGNERLVAPAGQFQQLSVSRQQACAIDLDGAVSCWGANDQGTTDVPDDLGAALKVVSGFASSCALLLDGRIDCWGRPVYTPAFFSSDTGPYVDLHVVSYGNREAGNATVCGVEANGEVDCEFTRYADAIQSRSTPNDAPVGPGIVDLSLFGYEAGCYIGSDGDISCFGRRNPTTAPSLSDVVQVQITTGLRADTYSTTTIELFWDSPRDAFNVAGHEIQRNGEVFAFTTNGSSFIIDDMVPGELTNFAVRRIELDGTPGDFSNTIEVTIGDAAGGTGTDPVTTGYQPPARPFETKGLNAQVYGSTEVELFWDRENSSSISGYEIRRNGEFVGFSVGTSFIDFVPTSDRVYRYDVIPVDRTDASTFYGFASIDVAFGAAEPVVCM